MRKSRRIRELEEQLAMQQRQLMAFSRTEEQRQRQVWQLEDEVRSLRAQIEKTDERIEVKPISTSPVMRMRTPKDA